MRIARDQMECPGERGGGGVMALEHERVHLGLHILQRHLSRVDHLQQQVEKGHSRIATTRTGE